MLAPPVRQLDTEEYLPFLSKLHRVVEEINQHLPQPARIPEQLARHAGIDIGQHFKALLVGVQRNGSDQVRNELGDIKRDRFDAETALHR